MHYSKNKERQLEAMYPTTDDSEIAKILGLSIAFVRRKAEELGLEKENLVEWTASEIRLIEELYPIRSNKELSELFGRSKMEIDHFAFRLGLSKARDYFMVFSGYEERELVDTWSNEYSSKENGSSRGNYVLGKILAHMFPHSQIFPEHPIGSLRLDFYLPTLSLGFEFQGIQHTEYNSFHYKTKADFYRAQGRDYAKSEMCEAMNIGLVHIGHDEALSISIVRAKIEDVI